MIGPKTYNQFKGTKVSRHRSCGRKAHQCPVHLKRLNIAVRFIDDDDVAAFEAAIDDKTKALYVESIGDPDYNVAPISKLASVSPVMPFWRK